MAEEKLLTVREVSMLLSISEREVMDLAENGKLPAYKVAGVYLRFKRQQVEDYLKSAQPLSRKKDISKEYPLNDRINDFFYFNDFYILATLVIILILIIIFQGY